jgi:uncharacterized protein YjbI with pentapeptide repeats
MLHDGRSNWGQIGRIGTVETDGRVLADLRGIILRGPDIGHPGVPPDERPVIRDIDFSGCLIDPAAAAFADVTVIGCRLVGADLGQRVEGRFAGCDFSRMKQHNGWLKGEFTDCRFIGADLRHCILGNKFVRCDFSAADLQAAEFVGTFEDCRWDACRTGFGTVLPTAHPGS